MLVAATEHSSMHNSSPDLPALTWGTRPAQGTQGSLPELARATDALARSPEHAAAVLARRKLFNAYLAGRITYSHMALGNALLHLDDERESVKLLTGERYSAILQLMLTEDASLDALSAKTALAPPEVKRRLEELVREGLCEQSRMFHYQYYLTQKAFLMLTGNIKRG
jgi:uncharacterized glyoxalase superfamily protein PhnB